MAMKSYNFIHFVSFKDIPNWSVQYANEENLGFTNKYPMVRIGSFLTRRRDPIEIQDGVIYKRVTISTKDCIISIRDEKDGKDINTKNQFVIHKGQFILSKIDARNGAFGVVPEQLDGGIITTNFWTYDVNYQMVNPLFLALVTKTKQFRDFAEKSSNGTTNRHYLQEYAFSQQKIPLPSLEEQEKILEDYNSYMGLAKHKQEEIDSLGYNSKKYIQGKLGIKHKDSNDVEPILQFIHLKEISTRWDAFVNTFTIKSNYYIDHLGNYILYISTGTTPPTSHPEYFNGNIKFFTPADLGKDKYLDYSSRTISEIAIFQKKARIFHKGDILFVGIGSTVGKVGIVKDDVVSSNQQITGFTIDSSKINPEYVYYYLQYNRDITTSDQSKTTLPIVNQEKICKIPIVVPPIDVQNEIVAALDDMYQIVKMNEKEIPILREKAFLYFEHLIFD